MQDGKHTHDGHILTCRFGCADEPDALSDYFACQRFWFVKAMTAPPRPAGELGRLGLATGVQPSNKLRQSWLARLGAALHIYRTIRLDRALLLPTRRDLLGRKLLELGRMAAHKFSCAPCERFGRAMTS